MRHSTPFGLLGIAIAALAISACSLAMAPKPKPAPTYVNIRLAESQLATKQRQLADNQASIDAMTQPSTTEVAQTEDLPTTNPRGIPVAHAMPWKGMPATLIGSTYLGEPDETGGVIDGGLLDGGTPYYWRSRNEKHERVFEAVVRDGEVIDVSRWNQGANYWPESTSLNADALPILDASGARNDVSSGAPDLPDPNDYDNPDDYEADAEDYFTWLGCDDPAQAAYLYWESIAGQAPPRGRSPLGTDHPPYPRQREGPPSQAGKPLEKHAALASYQLSSS